jgi:tRNA 2-thiouridine synthesizing protein A
MELKKSIEGKNKGDVIDLTFTCPEAVNNVPEYCEKNNYNIKEFTKNNNSWNIKVEI